MVRVLHAADFHLDSAFRALPEEKARQRRRESRQLVERMVDYANDHDVQLLLLAGDLFDSADIYSQTGRELATVLKRFAGHTVIAPGNHDCYSASSPYALLDWPENVHIFRGESLERLDFPQYNCSVWGAAFVEPECHVDLSGWQAPEDGNVHLMVLHGDLSSGEGNYRPITPAQIAGTGLDYLALGHVHSCSGLLQAGRTVYAYPGCPEGRGFDELGEKGFLTGTVGRGAVRLDFVPFARRRYQVFSVDVSEGDAEELIRRSLPMGSQEDICRVLLTGEREAPVPLERLTRQLADCCYHLELRDKTRPREDLWQRQEEDSLRGLFLRNLKEQMEGCSEEERQRLIEAARFGLAALDNREL
ncbi:MAG: DNA repair exonuclease [Ruminococcaceae bacterium]|nr:DNA repair exonuclease [Oscillospiraceae bacterium]